MTFTFARTVFAALTFTCSLAAAAPRAASPASRVQKTTVVRTLDSAALKGVFSDDKAFSNKLDQALGTQKVARKP